MAYIESPIRQTLTATSMPEKLPTGYPGGAEPSYDHLYVVRILDCCPKQLDVKVKRLPRVAHQLDLGQDDLNLASQPGNEWNELGVSGNQLDLNLSSRTGALVIFHLVDTAASFIVENADDPGWAILKSRNATPDVLYNPMWVAGYVGMRTAVSVVLTGGVGLQDYALGINVRDVRTSVITPIFIDPKIQNDGNG